MDVNSIEEDEDVVIQVRDMIHADFSVLKELQLMCKQKMRLHSNLFCMYFIYVF